MIPFAFIQRQDRPKGQRVTAATRNVRPTEAIFPQQAPDAPRQGDVPARPARMPVAVMSDPTMFGGWGVDEFIPMGKNLTRRLNEAGIPRGVSTQSVSPRPNLDRPPSLAYGSLFDLSPQNYGFG